MMSLHFPSAPGPRCVPGVIHPARCGLGQYRIHLQVGEDSGFYLPRSYRCVWAAASDVAALQSVGAVRIEGSADRGVPCGIFPPGGGSMTRI